MLGKLATVVEDDPKAPFSIATTSRGRAASYIKKWHSVAESHSGRSCWRRHGSGLVLLDGWIISFGLRGPSPQAFTPFEEGWVDRPAPLRRMPMGP